MSKKWQVKDGWLQGCRHMHSPFFGERPQGVTIDLLVVHNISVPAGSFQNGNIDKLFLGCMDKKDPAYNKQTLEVSAHLLIDRLGVVTQYVCFDDRAWHAGVSEHDGRPDCNDFSIGIELEGSDDIRYTDIQYQVLNDLNQVLCEHYPLASIVGHSDIAPGRKTDPGPSFDWSQVQFNSEEQK